MSAPATIAIVLAVAIPLQLVRAYRVKDAHVEAWARDHGLELTDGNRPIVARYLRRAQVARTWGGIAGVIVPSVIDLGVALPGADNHHAPARRRSRVVNIQGDELGEPQPV